MSDLKVYLFAFLSLLTQVSEILNPVITLIISILTIIYLIKKIRK